MRDPKSGVILHGINKGDSFEDEDVTTQQEKKNY